MSRKKIFVVLLVIFLLVFLLVGYWFFVRKGSSNQNNSGNNTTTSSSVQVNKPAIVTCPQDEDCDGVSDAKEKELGTSNRDFDTDGDGLSDYDEVNKWHTDPTKVDTDGDGYWDGYEILNGYNPNGSGTLKK